MLADSKATKELSRLKSLPVQMRLELAVDESNTPSKDSQFIQEFPLPRNFRVNSHYQDLLYVYPRQLNLRSTNIPGRNNLTLAVKIQLMDSSGRAVKAVVDEHGQLTTAVYTRVQYHNKAPQFGDEVKMQLPLELSDGYHLLFTLYHISCKEERIKLKQQEERMETPIGYTV